MDKIYFNSLLVSIQEALNATQKKNVDSWEKGDNSFSDHLFRSKSHQNVNIPIEHPEQEGHKDEIHSHLEPHGYQIKDYKSGIATDKHGRDVKIGKALNATKAPEDLKNKFQNDPSRQSQDVQAMSKDLRITLSRHPHHVAGMTSSGHCWEESSCMNFETGSNRDYLKQDLKHGTHVAYLHHKDDKDIKKPYARIALKKFTDQETGHSILRPEDKTYGAASDAFAHSVHKFIDHHMPANEDGMYERNPHTYNDFGNTHIIGKGKLDSLINDKNSKVHHDPDLRDEVFSSPLSPKHIDTMVNHGYHKFKRHPNSTPKQVDKWVDDIVQNGGHKEILSHPKLTSNHIHKILDSNMIDAGDKDHILRRNPKVKDEHVMKHINNHGNLTLASDNFENNKLSDKSIHHLIDKVRNEYDNDHYSLSNLARNPNLKKDHIDKILDAKPNDPRIYRSLLKRKLTPNQVDRVHSSIPINEFAEYYRGPHPDNLQDKHIHNLINHYAKKPQSNDYAVKELIHINNNFNRSHAYALDKHQFPKYLVRDAHAKVDEKEAQTKQDNP